MGNNFIMPTNGESVPKIQSDKEFERYEEEIVSNPAFAGMPDLRYPDGRIQWEAPSNRRGGGFRDSHDKRYAWWRNKAEEIGISTSEDHWISKVAKRIRPTKKRPCKICGRIMDIRYCYLNSSFMQAVRKLAYVGNELEMDECTNILDFVVEFEERYGAEGLEDLRKILRCKAVEDVPMFEDIEACIRWLQNVYIPAEPSRLSPGSMSNAPDRLDGFHTYNRCCRHIADKGRSKANLASYSTDRRAFEYWVDGNWVTANKTMGLFRSDPEVRKIDCFNSGNGSNHPKPCAADHIGPISLGFAHRPEFQPLCTPCNSAKNNRMYLTDVEKLIASENKGERVTSWYAQPIWDRLKSRVKTQEDAAKLTRAMRDNRHNAMKLLGLLLERCRYAFLTTFLSLEYANSTYTLSGWTLDGNVTLRATFDEKPSELEYSRIQKARRTRIAFLALREYAGKDNRNGFNIDFKDKEALLERIDAEANRYEGQYPNLHSSLVEAFAESMPNDEVVKTVVDVLPLKENAIAHESHNNAISLMREYMAQIADEIEAMWDDSRYERLNYWNESDAARSPEQI